MENWRIQFLMSRTGYTSENLICLFIFCSPDPTSDSKTTNSEFSWIFQSISRSFWQKTKNKQKSFIQIGKKFNLWRFTFWTCYIFCSSCQKLILNSDSAIIFHNIYFCLLLMQISFYFVKLSGISTKLFIAGKLSELTLTMAIHLFGHLSV